MGFQCDDFNVGKAPVPNVAGSTNSDAGKDGIRVKGQYPSGTGQKTYSTVRGAGAAVRGKKFREVAAKE